jgi:hypothetical protein
LFNARGSLKKFCGVDEPLAVSGQLLRLGNVPLADYQIDRDRIRHLWVGAEIFKKLVSSGLALL